MMRKWITRKQAIEMFSDLSPKAIRHNEELHKTSAYLAEQARGIERAMNRARWGRR